MPTVEFDRQTTISFPGSSVPDITRGIQAGSLSIREVIATNGVKFGEINSNSFQCIIHNCPNVINKKIVVKQTDGEVERTLFEGYVDSCKLNDFENFRTIVAYDYLYKARKKSIKKAWKTFWNSRSSATVKQIYEYIFQYYSVDYVISGEGLEFDSLVIKKTKSLTKIKKLTMSSFISQLCEFNMCIPNMSRNGALEFIDFSDMAEKIALAVDIRGEYGIKASEFENFTVPLYNEVEVVNESSGIEVHAGDGDNVLVIQNNLFLYNLDENYMQEIANYIKARTAGLTYTPGNITMKVSRLDIYPGDLVQVERGYCLICENNYSGSLLVNQTIKSTYDDEGSDSVSLGGYKNPARKEQTTDYQISDINTQLEEAPQVTINDNGTISIATSKAREQSGAYIRTFQMIMYHPFHDWPEVPAPYYQIWEVTVHSTSGVVLCFSPTYIGGEHRSYVLDGKTYYDTTVDIVTTSENSYITQKWVAGVPRSAGAWNPYGGTGEADSIIYLSHYTGYGTVSDSPYYDLANGGGTLIYDTYSGTASTDRSFVSRDGNYSGTFYYAMVNENVDVPGTSGRDVKTLPTATDGYDLANSADSLAKATQGQTYERKTPGFTGEINVMPTESIQTVTKSLDVVRENLPEANPTGTPTATAQTIKLNGTIYDLAGGSEAIELTQAEYNALTESEKNDPKKVYYITDAGGGGGASALSELTDVELTDLADGEILKYDATEEKWVNAEDGGSGGGSVVALPSLYSTKEKMVGLWKDNKPLYQKTIILSQRINITNSYNTYLMDDVSAVNMESLVKCDVYDSNSGSITDRYWSLVPVGVMVGTINGVNKLIAYYHANNTFSAIAFTVQYTKSTDTPVEDFNLQDFGIFAPVIYSLEEREIGVWTDGKPLYQKTIYSTTQVQLVNTEFRTIPWVNAPSNVDVLIHAKFSNVVPTLPALYRFYCDNGVIKGAAASTENFPPSSAPLYVTIEYTKTTDVAGSGSYAELGVSAVHYDDTERVIGTWFGETLYQKTIFIHNASLVYSQEYSFATDIPNVDIVIDKESLIKLAGSSWVTGDAYTNTSQYRWDIQVNSAAKNVGIQCLGWGFTDVYVTLKYTKTS